MKSKRFESFMKVIFILCSLVSIVSIVLICVFIFRGGVPFIKEYGLKNFLFGREWKPSNSPPVYGVLPMILGSFYVTIGAVLVGVPIGVMTATYMSHFSSKRVYNFLKPSINLMAGIPSIVYGFFFLTVVVPIIRNIFGGTGMNFITASLLLGVMILPTIIGISESALKAVPKEYYEGSIALGASHESSIVKVIIPAAKSGIMASIILGVGRAIGETMALILVAGNQARMPKGITKGFRSLTTNIVMDMSYASGTHREALIATAVVLFVFILIINALFSIVKRRSTL